MVLMLKLVNRKSPTVKPLLKPLKIATRIKNNQGDRGSLVKLSIKLSQVSLVQDLYLNQK